MNSEAVLHTGAKGLPTYSSVQREEGGVNFPLILCFAQHGEREGTCVELTELCR